MATVALVRCEGYHREAVRAAVRRGVDLLGGLGEFVRPGQRVLLKPNLLAGERPERAVTTHPAVFMAVAELAKEGGGRVSYGDSPALGNASRAAKKCRIAAVAESLEIPMADFDTPVEVFFDGGVQNRRFVVAKGVLEHDVIISLPKLKTHGYAKITGCVKNQFGCVPGMRKSEYHLKLPDAEQFAQMLVDLNNYLNPALYVMDGIEAMEGNGPRGGKPRRMNLLLFSRDPIALDATVCRAIDLNPELVPTIVRGYKSGVGVYCEREIQLVGDDLEGFYTPDFDVRRTPLDLYRKGGMARWLGNYVISRPVIEPEKCVSCGICLTVCPTEPKSLTWVDDEKCRLPVHNYETCIRCYCCQELCPEGAIKIRRPMIGRVFPWGE